MGLGAQGSEETGRSFEGCREAAEAPPRPHGKTGEWDTTTWASWAGEL